MTQPSDRLQALAEMDDLVRRAREAGDVESMLIARMVGDEAERIRAEVGSSSTRHHSVKP